MELIHKGESYQVIAWDDFNGVLTIRHMGGTLVLSGVDRDRAMRSLKK